MTNTTTPQDAATTGVLTIIDQVAPSGEEGRA